MIGSMRRSAVTLLVPVLLHAGAVGGAHAQERISAIAVFPVENLSADSIPADVVRGFLIERLIARGVRVLSDAALEEFMTRHRVRYAAGIDAATAASLRLELGVEAALFAAVELSSETAPPKMALFARLVSTADTPAVVWADEVGVAGDDAPGLFELGMVNDYAVLQQRALNATAESLLAFLESGTPRTNVKRASKFRPRSSYRALDLEPGRTYSVAVVPFFNLSERRNAGEILGHLFMRHLSTFSEFVVVDTGAVREQLIGARIIMDGGLSIADAETVAALIEADFVLGGRVTRYEDHEGPGGRTRVDFSTVLIDRKSRRVVWTSDSYNDGRDGVRLFERGTSRIAHVMATQMVRLAVEMIAGREK